MSMQNTIAGMLTAFGLIGLALAPLQSSTKELQSKTNVDHVTLAISLGTKLRLETRDKQRTLEPLAAKAARNMVCDDVYRLSVADIGLGCRAVKSAKTIALAN